MYPSILLNKNNNNTDGVASAEQARMPLRKRDEGIFQRERVSGRKYYWGEGGFMAGRIQANTFTAAEVLGVWGKANIFCETSLQVNRRRRILYLVFLL